MVGLWRRVVCGCWIGWFSVLVVIGWVGCWYWSCWFCWVLGWKLLGGVVVLFGVCCVGFCWWVLGGWWCRLGWVFGVGGFLCCFCWVICVEGCFWVCWWSVYGCFLLVVFGLICYCCVLGVFVVFWIVCGWCCCWLG